MGHQEKEKKNSLRDQMPVVSAWVDELREAFGVEEVNQAIRSGMAGKPTFHAIENGVEIGTAFTGGKVISGLDMRVEKKAQVGKRK